MRFGHARKAGIYEKSEMCDQIGVSLIHIYEDEWNNKQDVIKKYLKMIIEDDVQFKISPPIKLSRDKFPVPFL